jgi:hypothetical protein
MYEAQEELFVQPTKGGGMEIYMAGAAASALRPVCADGQKRH